MSHNQYSYAMVTPSLAASSGRSDFSCTSENQPDDATRSAVWNYIGLFETSPVFCEERISSVGGDFLDLNFGETELRLGPPGAFHSCCVSLHETHPGLKPIIDAADKEREQNTISNEQISCRGEAMVRCTTEDSVKNPSRVVSFSCENPDIPMNDSRMYSISQTTVTGAKRAFADVVYSQFAEEEAFSAHVDTVLSSSAADMGSKHARTRPMPPAYSWPSMNQMLSANLDQQRIPSTSLFQEQPNVKQSAAASSISLNIFHSKQWDTCPKIISDVSYVVKSASEAQYGQSDIQETLPGDDTENVHASSSPVVGWPPVQSFRNKALATQPQPKLTASELRQTSSTSTPLGSSSIFLNSLFVKVFMDGVAIGRKVDMKSSDSYEKLSSVLEEMFHRFASGKGKSQKPITQNMTFVKSNKETTNCRHGSAEYVLTYKDKDGDLMLVGDVPWSMFIGSVRRLRIMKGSDAIGLMPKALENVKLKP